MKDEKKTGFIAWENLKKGDCVCQLSWPWRWIWKEYVRCGRSSDYKIIGIVTKDCRKGNRVELYFCGSDIYEAKI